MTRVLFYLYSQVLYPFGWMIALLVSPFFKKIGEMFKDRAKPIQIPLVLQDKSAIWFHCASGEYEYARTIIKKIKKLNPEQKIVVSYMSPSYKKNIQSDPNIDFSFPLPWDFATRQNAVITKIKPKCVVLARTDFWPQFLKSCQRNKVLTIAIAVRTPKKINPISQFVLKLRLIMIDLVFTASSADSNTLEALSIKSNPVGDPRWDRVFERLTEPSKVLNSISYKKPLFVFGSTWPSDEVHVLQSLRSGLILKSASVVIAPHEVSEKHILRLEKQIHKMNFQTQKYSQIESWNGDSVLIVDQVGLLADLYRFAGGAFVGGSFDRAVHSVMEPLAAGCAVVVGPKHQKSREAIIFKDFAIANSHLHMVSEATNSKELENKILEIVKEMNPKAKETIQQKCKEQIGASDKLVRLILEAPLRSV